MGFLTSYSTSMYLTNYANQLERRLQHVMRMQMDLSSEIDRITTEISDYGDNESPAVQNLKARRSELEALDKKLQARMQEIKAKMQAVQTEKQSADQMLQQSIQNSFSYSIR